jgi:excisionase family DNA binding protein
VPMSLLTTSQVADRLGITVRRVQGLISDGTLPAQRIGRDYLVKEEDVRLAEKRNPVGRPRKSVSQLQKKGRSK